MTMPTPQPVADATRVVGKLQQRHAAVLGSADRELAVTQVLLEDEQAKVASLMQERENLLVTCAELTERLARFEEPTDENATEPQMGPPMPSLNGHATKEEVPDAS